MSPAEIYIYNRIVASEVTGIPAEAIKRVEVWSNCCFIYAPKYGYSRLVSKRVMRYAFVKLRRERAEEYTARAMGNGLWRVSCPGKEDRVVTVSENGLKCWCPDFIQMAVLFNQPVACKHCYAVLHELGFNTLSEFLSTVNDRNKG